MIKSILPVLEMSCAVCANNVESTVKKLPGVRSAVVNFAAENLLVEYDPTILSLEKIQAAVQAAGYDLIISEEEKEKQREAASLRHYKSLRNRMLVAWVFRWASCTRRISNGFCSASPSLFCFIRDNLSMFTHGNN